MTNKQSIIKIRPARLEELPTLLEFEQALIAYERPYAPNLTKEFFNYHDLEAYIKDPDVAVVVAEAEGVVVGSGYALIRKNPLYKIPDTYVYLGFMYVVPSYRGMGINGKILAYLFDWGKTKGYEEFQLTVYAENESAVKAYQKAGFEPEILRMRINKG